MHITNPEAHLFGERDKWHFDKVCEILLENNCKTICDIGCYDGWMDFLLIKYGFEVTSVELVPELANYAITYAKTNNIKLKVYTGNFLNLNIVEHFDAAICLECLEHVDWIDVLPFIKKMETISDHIIFSLPDQRWEDNPEFHRWTPTLKVIEDLFKNRKKIKMERHEWNVKIPPNWVISYNI
jgi:2-polyprenyl-3-methyl-5-hydroxy-6-metoxy-1,4-benzoquinol methylase